MKAKLIHLPEDVFKTLYKDAIDRGMSLKGLIEGILKRYAYVVNENHNKSVINKESPVVPAKTIEQEEPELQQ